MRLRWTRLADSDLNDVAGFVGLDNPAAAARVVLEIIEQTELSLKRFPQLGRPGRVQGTREFVISGLPYIVPYRVREDVIEVLRVFHTSRRWPGKL